MYDCHWPDSERRRFAIWAMQWFPVHDDQRRELTAGPGALRKKELRLLLKHFNLPFSEADPADVLAESVALEWRKGTFNRKTPFDEMDFPTALKAAHERDLDVRGMGLKEIVSLLKAHEEMKKQGKLADGNGESRSDTGTDSGTDTPVKRGPGRPAGSRNSAAA